MPRDRTIRRQLERDQKKLAEAKLKLESFEAGFSADKPIIVESSSQIEPHVRGMECVVCGVGFRVVEHVASPRGRVVHAQCPQCGRTPDLYFVLRSTLAS
jgi:hypothetical protein